MRWALSCIVGGRKSCRNATISVGDGGVLWKRGRWAPRADFCHAPSPFAGASGDAEGTVRDEAAGNVGVLGGVAPPGSGPGCGGPIASTWISTGPRLQT